MAGASKYGYVSTARPAARITLAWLGQVGWLEPDARGRIRLLDELGRDAQRARPAGRVRGHRAPAAHERVIGAEHQLLHGGCVLGRAHDAEVAFAGLIQEDLLLRTFHHMQNGCGALCVLIDAGGQIDLRRIRIALERLLQAQDGVGRRHFNSVEHDSCSLLVR